MTEQLMRNHARVWIFESMAGPNGGGLLVSRAPMTQTATREAKCLFLILNV
jgi:hypothetical protein